MKIILRYAAICLFACAAAWPQDVSTSQVKGTVQDPSGAVIAGAEIRLVQTDTGLVRTATTEVDGSYVLTSLPTGPYRLEVNKAGFAKYVQSGIVLQWDRRGVGSQWRRPHVHPSLVRDLLRHDPGAV